MFRLGRLRPFVAIFSWIAVCGVVVSVCLRALSATPALDWLPTLASGTGYLEENDRRIASAVEEYRRGQVAAVDHLAVFLGGSNVREDIDLRTIGKAAGANWHFLGLAGSGFMVDVAWHAGVLVSSPLRPDLVVVGITPATLAAMQRERATLGGFLRDVRRLNVKGAIASARSQLWFVSRRQDVSLETQFALADGRNRLFRFWDVRIVDPRRDNDNPWREMIKSYPHGATSDSVRRRQEQFFQGLGMFDANSYSPSSRSMAVLVDMIGLFRSRGAVVLLLLMPEHSTLRTRTPPEALAALNASLQHAFVQDMPAMVDLRAAAPDDRFIDLTHLNRDGSLRFSQELVEHLKRHFPSTPSLMRQMLATTRAAETTPDWGDWIASR